MFLKLFVNGLAVSVCCFVLSSEACEHRVVECPHESFSSERNNVEENFTTSCCVAASSEDCEQRDVEWSQYLVDSEYNCEDGPCDIGFFFNDDSQ